jgi:hypothetical protein
MKMMKINDGAEGGGKGGGQLHSASLLDGISISNHMAKHRNAVFFPCRLQNVGSACNAGGSSSLHTRIKRYSAHDAAAAMRSDAPQNQPAFAAAHVKYREDASSGTTSAAHSTARAPLQPHLYSPHLTPRHTLHYPPSTAPCRPVDHVHTGRRGGQSTARGRHAAAHDAHWHTRRQLREHVAEGQRRFFQMPLHAGRLSREEPRRRLYELDQALDVSVKLLGRLQLAVGDEGE